MDDKKITKEKIINQKVLERIFKDNHDNGSDTRFIFLLGAGSSVQSDIPSANKLATGWIEDIKDDLTDDEYSKWLKDKSIKEDDLASSYTEIYTKRFEHNPKNGYETLQKLMENKEPSIGYTILSQILEGTNHNFVITTNFDSLIEDALFLFTSKRPLVCGHESLADFIQLNSSRPTIIKVHRDILLNPYNTPENTGNMEVSLTNALKPILENSPMIILGYGGHDESILTLLKESNRQPIYWCVRDTSKVSDKIKDVLTNEADRIVKIDGFDEFMVALQSNVYDFKSIKSLSDENENESLIVKNALEKVKIYKRELSKFQIEVQSSPSEEFKENSKSVLPYWWDYQLAVDKEKDIEKKNQLFKDGINALPNSASLIGNYAVFLQYEKREFEDIEEFYKKSLLIEPNNSVHNGNYATYLEKIKNDYINAEIYYKKSLKYNSNNSHSNANYAGFLLAQNRKAESIEYLNLGFELAPKDNNDLILELWFYRLAHFDEYYLESKEILNIYLEKDLQSKNWDFSLNIKKAIENGNGNVQELKEYATKISGIDYSDI